MTCVRVKAIAIYHPENVVKNDFYIKHFEKLKGKDISHFLEIMGRKERYIIDNDYENGLSMGIEAAKRVLAKAEITGQDIDYIGYTTQIPEYTFPTNALFIHRAIEGKSSTVNFDMNTNCAGMTVAVEQASRYLLANKDMQTALIVGSDYNSLVSNPDQEITYANYGDAAAAIILEKTEEKTGFIDSIYHANSEINIDKILYPAKGLSHALNKDIDNIKYIDWLPFDGSIAMPPTYEMIEKMLDRNGLTLEDIDAYCLSQFALANIIKIQEHYNISDEKIVYIGDRFGYTGTSSPFIALHEGIEQGKIKRGSNVLFWTVGAGYQLVAMLLKY